MFLKLLLNKLLFNREGSKVGAKSAKENYGEFVITQSLLLINS